MTALPSPAVPVSGPGECDKEGKKSRLQPQADGPLGGIFREAMALDVGICP